MAERILCAWKRNHELDENNEHMNTGYISTEVDGTVILKEDFTDMPYHQMITRLSKRARNRPKADVHFMRLDQKPQPVAMQMNPAMLNVLKEDPVRYIRATSFSPIDLRPESKKVRSESRVKVTDSVSLKLRPLRAGVDTLADAFGDEVAVRVRFGDGGAFDAECPGCGRWAGFGMKAETGTYLIRCENGCSNPKAHGTWVPVEALAPLSRKENPRWAKVKVETLLSKKYKRYFLPRTWNTSGPWISHEDLQKKHEHYIKEKQACLDTQDTATSE